MTTLALALCVAWVIGVVAVTCLACWAFNKIVTAIMESID